MKKNNILLLFFILISCSRISAPFVNEINPENNENVLYTNFTVSISFNKEMDKESAEKAFGLYDNNDRANKIKGDFSWTRDKTMVFIPDTSEFHYPLRFSVTVEKTAADKEGNLMTGSFFSEFTLLSNLVAPRLVTSYPTDGATNFSVYSNLIFDFNIPLLYKEAKQAFQISPDPGGKVFVYSNRLIYQPSSEFENGTYYSVKITKDLCATNGAYLQREYDMVFLAGENLTVPVIEKVSTNINGLPITNGEHGLEKSTSNLIFFFNTEMNQSLLEQNLSIEPTISYHLNWLSNNILSMEFLEEMISSTNYLIKISKETTSRYGKKMENDFEFRYYTDGLYSKPVQFVSVKNGLNSWSSNTVNRISLNTNSISLTVTFYSVTNIDMISLFNSSELSMIYGPDSLQQGDISDIKDLGLGKYLYIIDNISVSNMYKLSLKGGVNEIRDALENHLEKNVDLYFIGTN